jgi:hypothetical protein
LVDLKSMAKYTYPTNTTGGNICLDDLKDATRMKRLIAGTANVFPVVALGTKHMNTAYGGRMRPSFIIKGWRTFGQQGAALPSTSAPATLEDKSNESADTEKPKGNKDLDDSIPFD